MCVTWLTANARSGHEMSTLGFVVGNGLRATHSMCCKYHSYVLQTWSLWDVFVFIEIFECNTFSFGPPRHRSLSLCLSIRWNFLRHLCNVANICPMTLRWSLTLKALWLARKSCLSQVVVLSQIVMDDCKPHRDLLEVTYSQYVP